MTFFKARLQLLPLKTPQNKPLLNLASRYKNKELKPPNLPPNCNFQNGQKTAHGIAYGQLYLVYLEAFWICLALLLTVLILQPKEEENVLGIKDEKKQKQPICFF